MCDKEDTVACVQAVAGLVVLGCPFWPDAKGAQISLSDAH